MQAGTQVCRVIAIVLSVCLCVVFVYLHVAQCVYRASAWEDGRRRTTQPRTPEQTLSDCTRPSIVTLWLTMACWGQKGTFFPAISTHIVHRWVEFISRNML